MPLFWCKPDYLFVMAAVGGLLFFSLRWLLRKMRTYRRRNAAAGAHGSTPVFLKLSMVVWLVVALLYSIEFTFGAFVEFTDAFSATNISDRWFDRYVEPYRNQDGFRDRREFAKGQQNDVTQVYFIGDSFTIGQGIERMEDRFTEQTEELLNARRKADEKLVRVYNAAEFGWEVSVIEGMIGAMKKSRIHPDVLVYVYMLNDIEGYDPRTEEAIKKIQNTDPHSWIVTRTYFFNWLYFRWRQSQASRTVDYFPHLADSYREAPWEGVKLSLLKIKQTCETDGMEFRMVLFPFLHNLGPEYTFKHAHQQLADFCKQNGIRCLDLEPILSQRIDENLMVNRFDNHPNEHCHAIAADAIANQLLDDLPLAVE